MTTGAAIQALDTKLSALETGATILETRVQEQTARIDGIGVRLTQGMEATQATKSW